MYQQISSSLPKFDLAEGLLEEYVEEEIDYPFEYEFEEFSFVKFLCLVCMVCHCCYSPFQKIEKEGLGFLIVHVRSLSEYLALFSALKDETFSELKLLGNKEIETWFLDKEKAIGKKSYKICHKNEFMVTYGNELKDALAKSQAKKVRQEKKLNLLPIVEKHSYDLILGYLINSQYSTCYTRLGQ